VAEIVVGIASSHSPQVSVPWQQWHLLREKDEQDPRLDYKGLLERARPEIESELSAAKMRERWEASQRAVEALGRVVRESRPDAIVVVGDDQHEQFHDDLMPTFAVYHGDRLPMTRAPSAAAAAWKRAEEATWAPTRSEYPGAPDLARHLIEALCESEFDVARSNRLREEIGVGHAFGFLFRRILTGESVPVVPLMVNTYYPPNQPTPRRCYQLGVALRKAIESWRAEARVALMASGGLSHIVLDEELDRATLEALAKKDTGRLFAIPRAKLRGGTSEILCWIVVAGAMESAPMHLIAYVPGYRSPAATGCGMAFAYWKRAVP
jgi:3-O-methylgallate 3,4-dioxygenase